MNSIIYQIAEQYLQIDHPAGQETIRHCLAKYDPFIVEEELSVAPRLWVEAVTSLDEYTEMRQLEAVKSYIHEAKIFSCEDGYFITIESGKHIVKGLVSKDWSRLKMLADWDDPAYTQLIDRMIMIIFSMAILPLGYLKVHASVIEYHGQALVLMGVSGTGKSTHSRLWLQYVPGCTLLNDDEPFVRLTEEGIVRVYGCPWSGSTECYRQASAEVAAFVHLFQSAENKLRPLSTREALVSLYSSCAFLLNEGWSRDQVFDSVGAVLSKVKIYRLDNRPEEAAVKLTRSLINL